MMASRQRLDQCSRILAGLKGRFAQPLTPAAAPAGSDVALAKKNGKYTQLLTHPVAAPVAAPTHIRRFPFPLFLIPTCCAPGLLVK